MLPKLSTIAGIVFVLAITACKDKQPATPAAPVTDTTHRPDTGQLSIITPTDTIPLSTSDTIPTARLIVPGKRIGQTAIGEKTTDVYKRLGPADFEDAGMGKSMSTWYSKEKKDKAKGAYQTMIYATTNMGDENEASRVSQVRITSPWFLTASHIGVGSSLTQIKAAFPDAVKQDAYSGQQKDIDVYDAVKEGIGFEIDAKQQCVGICIHRPNEQAFNTYLSFFEHPDKQ